MADIYTSTHAGAVIDSAVTDLVALVGGGLAKSIESLAITVTLGDITTTNGNVFINEPTAGAAALHLKGSRGASAGADTGRIFGYWDGNIVTEIRTNTGADTGNKDEGRLEFFTAAAGGSLTSRLTINEAGLVNVVGEITAGTKTLRIPHPILEDHQLVHLCVEAPKADLMYRGMVTLVNGKATVNIDEVTGMTAGTFDALCRDVQCFTTNESGWNQVRGSVSNGVLSIECQTSARDEVSWLVIGERNDQTYMESNTTDENGYVILEPEIADES